MGACCGKDQHSTTAYESRAKADDEPAVATPNREHRKGSIAHFSPQAKDLQTKQVIIFSHHGAHYTVPDSVSAMPRTVVPPAADAVRSR